jgi:probable HAF family extracellular repeat protein
MYPFHGGCPGATRQGNVVSRDAVLRVRPFARRGIASTVIAMSMGVGAVPLYGVPAYTGRVLYQLTIPNGITVATPNSGAAGAAAGGQVVGSGTSSTDGRFHAMLWSDGSVVDLNPTNLAGFATSDTRGTNGGVQVGYGSGDGTGAANHALLWKGTAGSAVDLNPTNLTGIRVSQAFSTNGEQQQVGFGSGDGTGGDEHALLWSGTADSAADLNPTNITGITKSFAYGTDGVHQVGSGWGSGTGGDHAMLWSGTASSAVDLHPSGFSYSYAYGTGGNQQVGQAMGSGTGFRSHAMLWSGTAESAVDLNPTDIYEYSSFAVATNGFYQVGYGTAGEWEHALLWSGTADSMIDLHGLLTLGDVNAFTAYSEALTIDAAGNVYGVAGGLGQNGGRLMYAVEWSPVPEPSLAASVLLLAGVRLGVRWRR